MYVEHLPPPPIKSKPVDKSEKYFVKLKLSRDPTSSLSEIYEFKMALFENGEPEEFLLFMRNFNMTLVESGMMSMGTEIKYIRNLVRG